MTPPLNGECLLRAVNPSPHETRTLEVCIRALVSFGHPAAPLRFHWFRRDDERTVKGVTVGVHCWIAIGQSREDLQRSIVHEAAHGMYFPGGGAEAEEQATRFEQRMMHAMGWA